MKTGYALIIFLMAAGILVACRKEKFTDDPGARLLISEDSLHFDTVFTTTGSTSQIVKVFNDNNRSLRISSIKLAGGNSSAFRINADGIPGPEINNIDLAPGDSTYIFVTVTINPNTASLPFIVRDSISVSWNGNTRFVQLDAYGQNAHFFKNRVIKTNETWINDLPYVIVGGIIIDTNATLTINKGARIFIHGDAPFIVNGSMQAIGEKYDSTRIVFNGDRLDEPYKDYPGSFPGLFFNPPGTNSLLEYVTVKNAYQAIIVSGPVAGTKLTLKQCILDNAYDVGLGAVNSSIKAENILISNSGKNLVLIKGGDYDFTHCTVASYSNAFTQHADPVLILSNYITQNNVITTAPLTASFKNCIFWGEANGIVKDEVVVLKQAAPVFSVNFDQVLWRVQNQPALPGLTITGAINNQNPMFDSVNNGKRYYDFRLKAGSPALNKGVSTFVFLDLDGLSRPVGLPDLGAYEKR